MSVRTRITMLVVASLAALMVPSTASTASAAAAPRLDSISVDKTAVTVPDEVLIGYAATSEPAITQALAGYTDPSGRLVSITLSTSQARAGWGTLALPDGVRNGTWKLQYVYLSSSAGNTYACRNGRTNSGCTEFRDLSVYDVAVSGSLEDESAPVVSSVTPPSTATSVGQPATITWQASDAHALSRISFTFRNLAPEARGHVITAATTVPSTLASGQLTVTVPGDAYDGPYTLDGVSTADTIGNAASYVRSGSVFLSGGATAPTRHDLDFSSITMDVTGSTRDVSPPVLTAVSASERTISAAQVSTVAYTATDASALRPATLTYEDPQGEELTVQAEGPSGGGSGTLAPQRAGLHRLVSVLLGDAANNQVLLRRDGTWTNELTGVTGTHDVDFTSADVTMVTNPVTVVPRPGPGRIHLRLEPQTSVDQQSITSYRVTLSPGGRVVDLPKTTDGAQDATITGLQNATLYSVRVVGVSSGFEGGARTVQAAPGLSRQVFAAGDVNADGRDDVFAQLPTGLLRLYRGTDAPGFGSGTVVADLGLGRAFASGPFSGSYSVAELGPEGFLARYQVTRRGVLGASVGIGYGWETRFLDGTSDFTGDKVADVVTVRHNGDAYLYGGWMDGRVSPGRRIATGWSSMQTVFAARDVTGNGTADLLTVDAAGALWVHPGTGKGTFNPRVKVGTGWGGLGALFAGNDLTGDGRVDLGAITMDGTFRVYPGKGQARFGSGVAVSKGWAAYL